jgi:hypothetical protein
MHIQTCDNCNCPKCLVQRAGQTNPAVQQALADAWVPEHQGWGLTNPPAVYGGVDEYEPGDYTLPAQRFHNDDLDLSRYTTHSRLERRTVLGILPQRKPADAFEWFMFGGVTAVVLALISLVVWMVWLAYEAVTNFGNFMAAHATQVISGTLTVGVVILLCLLCTRGGGGGKSFSGTFQGRMH